MNTNQNSLPRRFRGALNQLRGDVTQMSKRTMQHLGIVPPPFRISIDITDRCNFRCPTCSKWQTAPSTRELTLHEWKLIFEKIRGVPLLREISISGGEPFTRPDVFEILKLAKQQEFRIVLISNGWLVNEEMLKRLEDIRLDCLIVSLNSLRESVHDESRATTGSYKRIMHLVKTWRAHPRTTDLCLSTIIMGPNCGELSYLADFAHEKGLNGIMFQAIVPNEAHYSFAKEPCMPESAAAWYANNPLWVQSIDTLRQQVSNLLLLQKKGYPILNPPSQLRNFTLYFEDPETARTIPCLGTLSRMYIDPFGDIRLCYGYPPIGSILHDDPRRVWRSEQTRRIRQASRKCTRLCRMLNCNNM